MNQYQHLGDTTGDSNGAEMMDQENIESNFLDPMSLDTLKSNSGF